MSGQRDQETRIVESVVQCLLDAGMAVGVVEDSGDVALEYSKEYDAILESLRSSGRDYLVAKKLDGTTFNGSVMVDHDCEEPYEVIANNSKTLDEVLEPALAVIAEVESES